MDCPSITHDCDSTCCGFLIVAVSILRSPTRTTRLRSYRLVRLRLAPSWFLLKSQLVSLTFGSPILANADAQPYRPYSHSGIVPYSIR